MKLSGDKRIGDEDGFVRLRRVPAKRLFVSSSPALVSVIESR